MAEQFSFNLSQSQFRYRVSLFFIRHVSSYSSIFPVNCKVCLKFLMRIAFVNDVFLTQLFVSIFIAAVYDSSTLRKKNTPKVYYWHFFKKQYMYLLERIILYIWIFVALIEYYLIIYCKKAQTKYSTNVKHLSSYIFQEEDHQKC